MKESTINKMETLGGDIEITYGHEHLMNWEPQIPKVCRVIYIVLSSYGFARNEGLARLCNARMGHKELVEALCDVGLLDLGAHLVAVYERVGWQNLGNTEAIEEKFGSRSAFEANVETEFSCFINAENKVNEAMYKYCTENKKEIGKHVRMPKLP